MSLSWLVTAGPPVAPANQRLRRLMSLSTPYSGCTTAGSDARAVAASVVGTPVVLPGCRRLRLPTLRHWTQRTRAHAHAVSGRRADDWAYM